MPKRKPRATTVAKAKTPTKTPTPRPDGHGALMVGGVPGNAGGGRPKEVLRRRCREEIETRGGIEFVGRVMDGTETDAVTLTVGSGKDAHTEVVQVPAKIRDRLYAFELLADRGYGKPEQAVQIEDERPRRTGEEIMAHILELLPRVIATLPIDKQEIARLFAQRHQVEVLLQGKHVEDGRNRNGDGPA